MEAPNGGADPQPTKVENSVIRGLRAIEAIAATPLTASELARLLNVNRSTALRTMQELSAAGYVRRDPDTKKFSAVASRFASMVGDQSEHVDWSALLDPVLFALSREFNEAAVMGVPGNGVMVYIAFFPSTHAVAVRERLGTARPMHASALGKAYLGALDSASADLELGRISYEGGTDRAPRGPLELRERLDEVLEMGYAVDDEETFRGVACIAVPARVGGALVGAIGISGPSGRLHNIGFDVIGARLVTTMSSLADIP